MKNKQFKQIIFMGILATMSSVVPVSYGQTMNPEVINNTQEHYQQVKFPLLTNRITLKIGEAIDHDLLGTLIDEDKMMLPEGYRYQVDFIEGSQYFEEKIAVHEGKGIFRIQIVNEIGQVVAESKQCIKFQICKKESEVTTTVVPHTPYIQGYEDGTFRADQPVTREEFTTMVSRLMLKGTMPNYEDMYEDLDEYRYSTEHIEHLADKGIVTGYKDGMFMPKADITRAEAAHIIDGVIGYLSGRQSVNYSDVEASHWAYESIVRVTSMGYMEGSEAANGQITFRPNEALTRAEAVILLNKVFDRQCDDVEIQHSYKDLDESHWAYKEILDASIYHEHVIIEE